jgi:hypothetical protein
MLSYNQLQKRPKDFLAMTGFQLDEFRKLLVAFEATYLQHSPQELTLEGHARQRHVRGGAKGAWQSAADKFVCILVYQKTNPLQTTHAFHFGLSQPPANYGIHHLLPVLRDTLDALGMQPERDGSRMAHHHLGLEGGPDLAIDGSARRRQRPADATKQKAHDRGQKKTHTDKNLLLVNAHTGKVVSLSPTVAGHMHDKKMADEAAIVSPTNATLDNDPGFQGYEPEGVLTRPPKKTARPGTECR